jgi:hypothetical protein
MDMDTQNGYKHKENSKTSQHWAVWYLAQAVATKLNIANTKTVDTQREGERRVDSKKPYNILAADRDRRQITLT